MQLRLGSPTAPLTDGSTSYDDMANWVVNRWSPFLSRTTVNAVVAEPGPGAEDNGTNEIIFSKTIFGEEFGDVLAVSFGFQGVGEYRMENDIVVKMATKAEWEIPTTTEGSLRRRRRLRSIPRLWELCRIGIGTSSKSK